LARHPLNDPTPAGATDARVGARTENDRVETRSLSGICRDGHEARPVEGRPASGGDGCRRGVPKLVSALTERQGDKTRVVAFLHSHQDAALALRTRIRDDRPHVSGRRNGFATHFKDHVAG
jgi:hypothetical protein